MYDSNRKQGKIVLMQCTSKYPTPLEESGVKEIKNLEEMFNIPFGYSDHTRGLSAAKVAIVQGAKVLEKHVNFDLRMFGPDSSSPYNKDQTSRQLESVKKLFGRSVALKHDLKKGHVILKDDLTLKKPEGGDFSWKDLSKIVGRTLRKDLTSDVFLTNRDLV